MTSRPGPGRGYHGGMLTPLVALLLAASPRAGAPRIQAEGDASPPVNVLAGATDVKSLCRRLVPAERLRVKGDAVDQGEARAQQDAGRDDALAARYQIRVHAARLPFAPYDRREQQLELVAPATLRPGGGAALVAAEERGLPVRVDAATVRRILSAQSSGRLGLLLVFDLPDDAICAGDLRGKKIVLGVEPVEWSWLDGDALLARGEVSGDRPAVSSTAGARTAVEVGEPVAGSPAARKAVAARQGELSACYAEALKREPALDGVVVVGLGARVTVTADSTGSAELVACVQRALAPLAATKAASVPIRFVLEVPRPDDAEAGDQTQRQ
jgi:hypothetical protein